MEFRYFRKHRAELLIAVGRLILAIFSLLAIWLDPFEPSRYAQFTYGLLCGYVAYSLLLTVVIIRSQTPVGNLPIVTHAFDLFLFSIFMFLTEGPSSPFFVYFVFSIFCATLRWSWRGALSTAGITLMAFLGLGIYTGEIIHDTSFELNRFIIRSVYLSVVGSLLVYLGAYQERLREELLGMATWPRTIHEEARVLVSEMLQYAARIFRAPVLLLAWEEKEEPWIYLAFWSRGDFRFNREPSNTLIPLVAEPLGSTNFLCSNMRMKVPTIVHTSSAGLQRWYGDPLNPRLQTRFGARTVLSLNIDGHFLHGRLFVVDKKGVTSDDLVLGRVVAQEIASQMDNFYMLREQQRSAAVEERIRMARDLHDGLLQSLTVASLQMETTHRLIEADPQAAQQRLLEIQRLIAVEQKDLRSQIQVMKTSPLHFSTMDSNLAARLRELAQRVERHWGLRVEMRLAGLPPSMPSHLGLDIYFIIHESLINAARHANASCVRVALDVEDNHVNITVSDDGRGFPFHGRYDLTTLTAKHLGPLTLRERVIVSGGSLTIESNETGARLEIILPCKPAGD